ncbi:Phytochrome A-associated F-box protein [Platanthera zijinensis]|uniref:Phytochrome A-associated F-box protein n=1 Tax=Platanthera zijinensis TaxID=2320716 RepID=A0AAP0B3A8_9ASPA
MVSSPPVNIAVTTSTAVGGGGGGGDGDGFSLLSDDMLLDILTRLTSDPRDWSRLSCVSSRFARLIRGICCRSWCSHFIPSLTADLSISDQLPGGWAALRKLSMCCPGLHHAGVLLDEYPIPKCSKRPIWEPHLASGRSFSRRRGASFLPADFGAISYTLASGRDVFMRKQGESTCCSGASSRISSSRLCGRR